MEMLVVGGHVLPLVCHFQPFMVAQLWLNLGLPWMGVAPITIEGSGTAKYWTYFPERLVDFSSHMKFCELLRALFHSTANECVSALLMQT